MDFKQFYLLRERQDVSKVLSAKEETNELIRQVINSVKKKVERVLTFSPGKTSFDDRMEMRSDIANIDYYIGPITFSSAKNKGLAEYDPEYKKIIIYNANLAALFQLIKSKSATYLETGVRKGVKQIKKELIDDLAEFIKIMSSREIFNHIFHEYIHREDDIIVYKGTNLYKQALTRGRKLEDIKYYLAEFYRGKIKKGEMTPERAQEEYSKRVTHLINKEYYNNTGEINAYTLQIFQEVIEDNHNSFEEFLSGIRQKLQSNLKYLSVKNKKELIKRAYQFYTDYISHIK